MVTYLITDIHWGGNNSSQRYIGDEHMLITSPDVHWGGEVILDLYSSQIYIGEVTYLITDIHWGLGMIWGGNIC